MMFRTVARAVIVGCFASMVFLIIMKTHMFYVAPEQDDPRWIQRIGEVGAPQENYQCGQVVDHTFHRIRCPQ